MQAKSWIALKVLLNHYHEDNTKNILKGLPSDDAQTVLSQDVKSKDVSSILYQPQILIKEIHYSWLTPVIKELPENLQSLVLSSLPKAQSSKICAMLQISPPITSLAPSIQSYLLNLFYKHLNHTFDILPIEFLPQTPLTLIAKLNKHQIMKLIDFLGIYDLADEMRHIVDKNLIKNIYECLSPKKQRFLKQSLYKKEKLVTLPLKLEHWNGDHKKLIKLLHHRGLVRLGYALSGQHPDLIWHITHILDTGRGNKLMKYYTKEEIPGISQAVTKEVTYLLKYLEPKSQT